jgi:hypothetical protein
MVDSALKTQLLALPEQDRCTLAAELVASANLALTPKAQPAPKQDIGHFDLLFTVLYAAIVTDIFHTIAKSEVFTFPFLMGVTLLIVVIDHWLMHYRNHDQINQHPYFSLVTIGFTLFFYGKANEILSASLSSKEPDALWRWIILMFCTSFVMKRYYPDRWFHRIWDFIAVGACLLFIAGINRWNWTDGSVLGWISLSLATSYLPFEIYHYRGSAGGRVP